MKALGYKSKAIAVTFTVLASLAVFEMGDGYQAHPAHTGNKKETTFKPILKLYLIQEISLKNFHQQNLIFFN